MPEQPTHPQFPHDETIHGIKYELVGTPFSDQPHSELTENTRIDPAIEAQMRLNQQATILIELGFHKALGLSEAEYRQSLPEMPVQPEQYRGRFDFPTFVDPRIPITKQLELTQIQDSTNEFIHSPSWSPKDSFRNLVSIPDQPYVVWAGDPRKERYEESVQDILKSIPTDETPSPLVELIALQIQRPDLFLDQSIFALGSRFGESPINSVPMLTHSKHVKAIPSLIFGTPTIDGPHNLRGMTRGNIISTKS